MNIRKVNDEVFIADEPIVELGKEEVGFVKKQALSNGRKRARICAHRTNDDALHEMVIAISADSYIHPHKHLRKVESFHIVEGEVDVVVFDDAGEITKIIELGDAQSGKSFFYRLSQSMFHTLVIKSPFLVVHEVTNGPFLREQTVMASFAPGEELSAESRQYMDHLAARVAEFKLGSPGQSLKLESKTQ